MVVNFRTHKISQVIHKLIRTPTIIHKKKISHIYMHVLQLISNYRRWDVAYIIQRLLLDRNLMQVNGLSQKVTTILRNDIV